MFDFLHDTFHECRFTFTVFTDKSYFITTLNRQVSVAEHHFLSVCLSDTFHDNRITARTGGRREFQSQCRSILLIDFEQFQLFQHFDAALYLQRL